MQCSCRIPKGKLSTDSHQVWLVTWSTYTVDKCLATRTIELKQAADIDKAKADAYPGDTQDATFPQTKKKKRNR